MAGMAHQSVHPPAAALPLISTNTLSRHNGHDVVWHICVSSTGNRLFIKTLRGAEGCGRACGLSGITTPDPFTQRSRRYLLMWYIMMYRYIIMYWRSARRQRTLPWSSTVPRGACSVQRAVVQARIIIPLNELQSQSVDRSHISPYARPRGSAMSEPIVYPYGSRRDNPGAYFMLHQTGNETMKRVLFTMLAAVAMMIAMAGGPSATAQCPPKCTYHVSVLCPVSPKCLPLQLTTGWHCLNMIQTETRPLKACGEYDFPKVGPCEPVPCDLLWASLDGGTTIVVPNGPSVNYFCADGTVLCLALRQLADGCSVITITPGPGPCN